MIEVTTGPGAEQTRQRISVRAVGAREVASNWSYAANTINSDDDDEHEAEAALFQLIQPGSIH